MKISEGNLVVINQRQKLEILEELVNEGDFFEDDRGASDEGILQILETPWDDPEIPIEDYLVS